MATKIFKDYLTIWDRSLNTKIGLIIDNCPAHDLRIQQDLKNIELIFLPPNCTSVIQPLDRGIIKSWKSKYKKLVLEEYFNYLDKDLKYSLSIKNAFIFIKIAWDDVKNDCIKNCFNSTIIFEGKFQPIKLNSIEISNLMNNDFFEGIKLLDKLDLENKITFEEYVDCENINLDNESEFEDIEMKETIIKSYDKTNLKDYYNCSEKINDILNILKEDLDLKKELDNLEILKFKIRSKIIKYIPNKQIDIKNFLQFK